MNQPQQATCKHIAELLNTRTVRVSKWIVRTLSDLAADSHFTKPEVIEYAEPVFMIYGRKESIEALRIDQERSARYEWLVLISDHSTDMPDYGRVRVFVGHLYTYNRIFILP